MNNQYQQTEKPVIPVPDNTTKLVTDTSHVTQNHQLTIELQRLKRSVTRMEHRIDQLETQLANLKTLFARNGYRD